MRPLSRAEILEQAGSILDDEWAWWDREDLRRVLSTWSLESLVRVGKGFAPREPPAGMADVFERLAKARTAAVVLAETLPAKELAREMPDLDDELFKAPLLTAAQERRLGCAAQRGDRCAINALVAANTRLAASVAFKQRRSSGFGVDDCFQEACLGLIRAAEKFDPGAGFRFTTYATWWIRQSISRALADKSRTIRVPVHVNEQLNKLAAIRWKCEQDTGRQAPIAYIAREMGTAEQAVRELDQVEAVIEPLSAGLGVADRTAASPEDLALAAAGEDELGRFLALLDARTREVIRRRNGIGYDKQTLEQVGEIFGVTRERIRQIESEAMKRLQAAAAGEWVCVHKVPTLRQPGDRGPETPDTSGHGDILDAVAVKGHIGENVLSPTL